MRKLMTTAAAVGLAVGSLVAAPMAHGTPATATCEKSGHTLNATANFSTSGSYHRWSSAQFKIGGAGTGGKSNVNIRLRSNGVDKWSYNSPDDIDQGTQYSVSMDNTATRASETEYVLFRGIFDTAGSDPACNAYTRNI